MSAPPARERVRVLAPAKVNPFLEVVGRRPDGYHEVDTLLCALALADRVTAERTHDGRIELEVAGPQASADVPRDPTNLAWRAAELVLAQGRARGALSAHDGVRIALEKNVPSGAGLGGGSSDAAAALFASQTVLEVPFTRAQEQAALAALGSDCVFFSAARESGLARCRGRGELVEPWPALSQPWHVALLTPREPASTRDVYAALHASLSPGESLPMLKPRSLDGTEAEARAALFNRLEEAALSAVPVLRMWRETLDRCGAGHFRLAGSGSSFFGLYASEDAARLDLELIVRAARERRLEWRGTWLTRVASHGVRLES